MGRKEFEKVTAISANPSYNMKYITAGVTTPVGIGETVEITVFASPGTVATVEQMYLYWAKIPGATSGDRLLFAGISNALIGILWGVYQFGSDIIFRYGQWEGTGTKYPADSSAQSSQQKVTYDENDGLSFKFTNQTNVADSNLDKRVRLWVKETKIV
jgi:hypothetical protein